LVRRRRSELERYEHEPEQPRREIPARLTVTQAQFLTAYAERMASLALTLRSERVLRSGLIGVGLASQKEYFKEIVPVLALIHHSAEQLDVDPRGLFADASAVVVPPPEEYFREFPDRRPELRSLDAMGYTEHPSDNGLQYERTRSA
jgi:hypothetical protein